MTVRYGAIRYLNALPLVEGLEKEPDARVRFEIPGLLAEDLRAGELDLALVPWVEAAADPRYRMVPGQAIGCRGAVRSILLFERTGGRPLRRIGVDLSSRTSVQLLRVLLRLDGASEPELVPVPPRLDPLRNPDGELDAILLIGDCALAADRDEFPRRDLDAEWFRHTGLPFVFAVWLGREGLDPRGPATVRAVARRGLARRSELAEAFVREHPEVIGVDDAKSYLRESIRYDLGEEQIESMRIFHRHRRELDSSLPADWEPRFFHVSPGEGS